MWQLILVDLGLEGLSVLWFLFLFFFCSGFAFGCWVVVGVVLVFFFLFLAFLEGLRVR